MPLGTALLGVPLGTTLLGELCVRCTREPEEHRRERVGLGVEQPQRPEPSNVRLFTATRSPKRRVSPSAVSALMVAFPVR